MQKEVESYEAQVTTTRADIQKLGNPQVTFPPSITHLWQEQIDEVNKQIQDALRDKPVLEKAVKDYNILIAKQNEKTQELTSAVQVAGTI